MNKTTNDKLLINGQTVESEITFIAEASEGIVSMQFVIDDASQIGNGKVVVFEELYRNGILIGEHKDIDDEGQTVEFYIPPVPPTLPPTGQARLESDVTLNAIMLTVPVLGISSALYIKRHTIE